jgi:hypothetical protein
LIELISTNQFTTNKELYLHKKTPVMEVSILIL